MDICSFVGFDSLNGSNLRVFHMTNELIKRGHELRFITPGPAHAESCKKKFGVEAVDVGLDIQRFNKSRLKLYPMYAWKARKLVDRKADIVFGQSLPAALAVRLSKTTGKKVIDYVDLWSEYWLYAHRTMKGYSVYEAIRKAESFSMKVDMIFTITNELKKMIEKRGGKSGKIRIVRDGVDTKMFRPMKVKNSFYNKYNLDKKTDYIAYQGGIAAHDGVQFLVDAAPLILKEHPGTSQATGPATHSPCQSTTAPIRKREAGITGTRSDSSTSIGGCTSGGLFPRI